jgi:hypothetical protein
MQYFFNVFLRDRFTGFPRSSVRWVVVRVLVAVFALVLGGCHRHERQQPDDRSAAHEAGREAYKLSQETKRLAKAAGRELRQASKEAHKGWVDAEHQAKTDQR